MKKISVISILMIVTGFIFAHSPSDIKLNYDAKTSMLSINVIHQIATSKVPDPMKHYVKDITVTVNGKDIIVETLAFQQSDDGAVSTFLLKVKKGDKVSVKANCSLAGSKSVETEIK